MGHWLPTTCCRSWSNCRSRGIWETTRRAVRRLTAADGVTFVLRQGEQCFYADEDAIAPLWKGRRFPLDQCVSGWVMLNRQTAVIPDIYSDPRVPTEAYRPTFVQSLLMVPVRKEDPVGAIGVYWASRHEAAPGEQDLVQAVANGAALALANVKLVRDLEDAAERERGARLVAERANQLTDQFLATISHELRTPLNVIHGWLWQLRQPGTTPELARHALAIVERNAAIQTRLVEDLIDASRAMSGGISLQTSVVDVNEVCKAAADAERPAAEAKGLQLLVEPDADALPVLGDTGRLGQILRNLLDNSVKFTGPGGAIVVRARKAGSRVRITVQDNGIGIHPDALRRVFDRFWQEDGSATRKAGGLGLGLALVHELVRLHGGRVSVESAREGAGTTVTVELPVAASVGVPDEAPRRSDDAAMGSRLAIRSA
jgi:signal transduction histidine kinase